MKLPMTEYLQIDLETEKWECRECGHVIGPARENYKEGLLVYARDPREIHRPLLDPKLYSYTFSPDPEWCAILEFYCPDCATMIEVEYTVPGHPPIRDIEIDIDGLKKRWAGIKKYPVQSGNLPYPKPAAHSHAHKR
ncbi:MAG TPA: acetone carboxylase subunit gamma [Candidatus Binataceae bacterium]|nr:acetone carboxylase subunit gamma [Candidatus Binataceae bacterium]